MVSVLYERKSLASGAVSMSLLVNKVNARMARNLEKALGPGGPALDQWRVLDLLADGQGHPMIEIAGHVMVPAPTLTKVIDRLVDMALVYRRPDESDRRRVLVFLSDRGREVHSVLSPRVTQAEEQFVGELDAADAAALRRLVERLAGMSPAAAEDSTVQRGDS